MNAGRARAVWLSSLALLIVNDHLLKGAGVLPGLLTGKASDLAGLVVAPVLVAVMLRPLVTSRRLASALGCGVIGLGFSLLQLSPVCAAGFDRLLSALLSAASLPLASRTVADPLDLVALPVLLLAYRVGLSLQLERGFGAKLLLSLASAACIATTPGPVTVMPHWGLASVAPNAGQQRALHGFSDGALDVRIGKVSSDQSFEVGLVVHAHRAPVRFDARAVDAWLGGKRVVAQAGLEVPERVEVPAGSAMAVRIFFQVGARPPPADAGPGDVPSAAGVLRVPLEVGGRRELIRIALSYRPVEVSLYETARMTGEL